MHPAEPRAEFAWESIGLWVTRRAALTPWRVAVEDATRQVTYAELNEACNRKAAGLVSRGVSLGDRVAIHSDNCIEYIETFFACAKLGAVVVPISTRLVEAEVDHILHDSQARIVLDREAMCDLDGAPDEPKVLVTASDALMLMYTSGTTGKPKGAVLTHQNFLWTNLNIVLSLDLIATDRTLMVLPMFHIGGWNVNTLAAIWKGATIVLEPDFDVERTFDAIEHRGVTWMMGVPSIYLFLKEHPRFETSDFSGLRFVVCGGAPAPLSLIDAFQKRGVEFIQGYGLTEAAPNALCLPAERSRDKIGAAGRPYFYTDVRLADGEIQLRGPSIMDSYHNRPEATEDAFTSDGWLRTGDVGRQDADGYFYVVDRLKDMIITGGENVYPVEVENMLMSHPAIVEAAVVGRPDERWGESVSAVVVLREGEELTQGELIQWCRDHLAAFKCPRSVTFTDQLPRTASGKVAKPQLRQDLSGRT